MKNYENVLKEYVRKLNDEDLRYIYFRCSQVLCGDRADISDFLAQNREIDRWLESASTCVEFFDMLDEVSQIVTKEYAHRFGD